MTNQVLRSNNGTICEDLQFNTPLNTNASVPAIQSTTFALRGLNADIVVQTISVGIRRNKVRNNNLGIQVYALEGLSLFYLNQPEAWRLVADSELVLNPYADTAVIPLSDFQSVEMSPDQRWNLYISTQDDAILDLAWDPDARNGRLAFADETMEVYTGAAFDNEAFEGNPIGGFSPNFAGTIYRNQPDCLHSPPSSGGGGLEITTESYEFVAQGEATESDFREIDQFVENRLNKALTEDDELSHLASFSSLKLAEVNTSTNGNFDGPCPDGWSACHQIRTSVQFEHESSMDAAYLKHSFFSLADEITNGVEKASVPIVYTGSVSVSAKFTIDFTGFPQNDLLDGDQALFVTNITETFLKLETAAASYGAEILKVQLDEQHAAGIAGQNLRRRLQTGGSGLQISGTVLGGVPAAFPVEQFGPKMSDILGGRNSTYTQLIKYAAATTTQLTVAQANFFSRTSFENAAFESIVNPFIPAASDGLDSAGSEGLRPWVWVLIGIILFALALILFVGVFSHCVLRKRSRKPTRKDRNSRGSIPHEISTRSYIEKQPKPSTPVETNTTTATTTSLSEQPQKTITKKPRGQQLQREASSAKTDLRKEKEKKTIESAKPKIASGCASHPTEAMQIGEESIESAKNKSNTADSTNPSENLELTGQREAECQTSDDGLEIDGLSSSDDSDESSSESSSESSGPCMYARNAMKPYTGMAGMTDHKDSSLSDMSDVSSSFHEAEAILKNPYLKEVKPSWGRLLDFSEAEIADTGAFGTTPFKAYRSEKSEKSSKSLPTPATTSLLSPDSPSSPQLSPQSSKQSMSLTSDESEALSIKLVDAIPPPYRPDQSKYGASFSDFIHDPLGRETNNGKKREKSKRKSGRQRL